MTKTTRILLATLLLITVTAAPAWAQPVLFADGAPDFTATAEDGSEVFIVEDQLQVLGRSEDGGYIVFIEGSYYTIAAEAMEAALYGADLGELTTPADYALLKKPSKGGGVLPMQQALDQLGYLEGTPDGDFGSITETALYAFQADMDLEQTGQADPLLQMLLLSITGEQVVVAKPDPTLPYRAISDRVSVNMEPIYESGMAFEYDDIAGIGLISNVGPIEYDASGSSDIEQYVFTFRVGLYVQEDADGTVDIQPAIILDCLCVRRPLLSEMIIKAGDVRTTLAVTDLSSSLSGARSVEHAVILLDDGGVEALKGAEEAGELRMRITGKYQTFEITFPETALAGISQVARVAEQLK